MGTRGPIAKRSDQLLGHRTKAEKAAYDKVEMIGEVVVPLADEEWHPLAIDWYESLAKSGQSRYYEPSDWAAAQVLACEMSRMLSGRVSSQMFAALWTAMGDLMTTEGSRRRVKVEVERKNAKAQAPKLASVTPIDRHGSL